MIFLRPTVLEPHTLSPYPILGDQSTRALVYAVRLSNAQFGAQKFYPLISAGTKVPRNNNKSQAPERNSPFQNCQYQLPMNGRQPTYELEIVKKGFRAPGHQPYQLVKLTRSFPSPILTSLAKSFLLSKENNLKPQRFSFDQITSSLQNLLKAARRIFLIP